MQDHPAGAHGDDAPLSYTTIPAEPIDPDSAPYVQAWDQHAARTARSARQRGVLRFVRETAITIALAVGIFVALHTVVQAREVLGPSMSPTYHTGQRLFVTRYLFGSPHHNDVIVFAPVTAGDKDLIKRVIGVPGDHITVKDGLVYRNGELLDEPYIHGQPSTCSGWCDLTLGPDQYYVMGDNRGNSADSRFFGPVTSDKIVGKAWLLFYPFSDFGIAP